MVRRDLIVLLAGLPGSGKSAVSEYLARRGFRRVVMGDIIRRGLSERGKPITSETMLEEAKRIRREYGPAGVATLTAMHIKETGLSPPLVIDGLRSLEELKAIFRELEGCHVLIYVHSSPMTRLRRLLAREREGDPTTVEEFLKRDEEEMRLGLPFLIALADYVLINEGSIEELYAQTDKALERVGECSGELLSRYL